MLSSFSFCTLTYDLPPFLNVSRYVFPFSLLHLINNIPFSSFIVLPEEFHHFTTHSSFICSYFSVFTLPTPHFLLHFYLASFHHFFLRISLSQCSYFLYIYSHQHCFSPFIFLPNAFINFHSVSAFRVF